MNTTIKRLIWGALILTSFASLATHGATPQQDDCDGATPKGLQAICSLVGDQVPEPYGTPPNTYLYQTKIQRSAGASSFFDSQEVVRKKIQHLWLTCIVEEKINCDSVDFNVGHGSLLKYAVAKRSYEFLEDAIETWGLPLNDVDESDGRTVMDYVVFEQEKARGTANEPVLNRMHEQFARAGAKLRKDLTPEDRFKDPYDLEIKPLLAAWDKACYFSEGLAAVKKDGKWGYVDRQHQIKVAPKYDGAFSFSQGRAAVVKDGKWGYIDKAGKEIIPLRYAGARVFNNTGAEVTKDDATWFTIDLAGLAVATK